MRSFSRAAALMTLVALLPASLSATWSVIAIDTHTRQIVIASATCVPQASLRDFPADGLMDIQAIIVPGVGVAAAQAGVDELILTHLDTSFSREPQPLIEDAKKHFNGPVSAVRDLQQVIVRSP